MIRVWRIALDPTRAPSPAAQGVLSDRERARAARFLHEADGNRWLHSHVAVRRILGDVLDVVPERIEFGFGDAGKPFVSEPAGSGVEFSLSDASDRALLAVSRVGPVGVDVERIRPLPDLEALVERFFAVEEREALFALPEREWLNAYYRIWTRKEAYLKAVGTGLNQSLAAFAVTVEERDSRFLRIDGHAPPTAAWTLVHIPVADDYVGALAVAIQDARVEVIA